ncbi:hypothetical protein ACIRPP_13075 [Streptomyces sp. NPDC101219]|uniref:hypothetical protein n=1 Tax=Streptomyces sp. NPDC101219 TaxID=3366131 RepID=UPI0037F43EB4
MSRATERSKRTCSGYAQDWVVWSRFCAETGLPPLSVTSGALVRFVEWLWVQPGWRKGTRAAPSTIDRRIWGTVATARTEHGLVLDRGVARRAWERLKQLVELADDGVETRGRGPWPW